MEAYRESSDRIAETADPTVSNLTTAASQARKAFGQIADSLQTGIADVSDRAADRFSSFISDRSAPDLETLDTAIGQPAIDANIDANSISDRALDTLAVTADQAKESLGSTIAQTEGFRRSVAEAVRQAIVSTIQDLLPDGTVMDWLLAHPLYAIGLVILLIFLLGGLLRFINRLTEQVWIYLLQLPINLLRWLGAGLFGFLKRKPQANNGSKEVGERSLAEILSRLGELQREEAELMQELQALLMSTNSKDLLGQKSAESRQ